jgi:hypothetical protein
LALLGFKLPPGTSRDLVFAQMKFAYGTVVFSVFLGWLILSAPQVCQNCWLPAERNGVPNGSSLISFIDGCNQGSLQVPGLIESLGLYRELTSLIRALFSDVVLTGILIRASVGLGSPCTVIAVSAYYLPWLSLAFFKLRFGASRHLVYARRSLSALRGTYYRSPSSTGLLESPASLSGMPELLSPNPNVC